MTHRSRLSTGMAGTYRSGRHRIPEGLRVLQGDKPKHGTPSDPVEPPMPETVASDELAAKYWAEYVTILLNLRVLNEEHAQILGALATVSADLHRVRDEYAASGYQNFQTVTYRGVTTLRESPYPKAIRSLTELQMKLLAEMGLTPITRSKVAQFTGSAKTGNDWDGLLLQGGRKTS